MLCWGESKKKKEKQLKQNALDSAVSKENDAANGNAYNLRVTSTEPIAFIRCPSPNLLDIERMTTTDSSGMDSNCQCSTTLSGQSFCNSSVSRSGSDSLRLRSMSPSSSVQRHRLASVSTSLREVMQAKLGKELSLDEDFVPSSTVGTGTFGRVKVVKFKNHADQTPMALKIVKKAEIIRMRQSEHIKNEKDILMELSHPFIVNLLATFQDRKRVFLLMEFVNGGELFTHLRNNGRVAVDEARFFAAEILLVFEYMHSRKIAYRDLKPENVLIAADGHVKLADFGFAKKIEHKSYTLCGTPEYLSPEVIGSKGHSFGVDWWALGILIYEMLDGMPPFHGNEVSTIYEKIMRCEITYPRRFNQAQRTLIGALLNPDPTKRLGCLENGAQEIKNMKFFRDVDWLVAPHKGLTPPRIPKLKGPCDTSQFDYYPDSEEGATKPIPTESQGLFRTFSSTLFTMRALELRNSESINSNSLMVPRSISNFDELPK
eukprot:GEMP01004691.1.p1 GENE.GEMP01004691.1~~GEMP01004691.1.p1  ORF type:complete len:488 (+),score=53.58 GEMP01004691.1:219-1682(+)